jgi:glycosyltransferase involved in cell wall biosynthesis
MLLEAVAPLVRSGNILVDIVGDGPQMASLKRQVSREGLSGRVALNGWVDQAKVAERLALSQVFAFPSIREFGGGVVLEAMAAGLAPVVVDYAGPAELVSDATGFRIPIGPRAAIVARFREVLAMLASRPDLVRSIGDKAQERVLKLFTWDAKAQQVLEVYRWVLGQRDRPHFGMPFTDDGEWPQSSERDNEWQGDQRRK